MAILREIINTVVYQGYHEMKGTAKNGCSDKAKSLEDGDEGNSKARERK